MFFLHRTQAQQKWLGLDLQDKITCILLACKQQEHFLPERQTQLPQKNVPVQIK